MKTRVRRVLGKGLGLLLSIIGALFPRKKGLIVFSQQRDRYSGNSRAFFEWLTKQGTYNVFWLYDADVPNKAAGVDDKLFVRKLSFRGFWIATRAEVAVISHGLADFGIWKYLVAKTKVLMLWHAIGIKMAGYLDRKVRSKKDIRHIGNETGRYTSIICSSDIDRYYTSAYQGVPVARVFVTGLPRIDNYIAKRRMARAKDSVHKQILYAPTFRDYESSRLTFFPFSDYDEAALVAFLREHGCVINLRPHPNDKWSIAHLLRFVNSYPDAFSFEDDNPLDDVADLLHQYDVIVTDYSSVYLDSLVCDLPVVFVPFDIDKYRESRGLAYSYDLVTPGPKVSTQREFIAALDDALRGAPAWRERRVVVRDMFHRYTDGSACERVGQVLEELVCN